MSKRFKPTEDWSFACTEAKGQLNGILAVVDQLATRDWIRLLENNIAAIDGDETLHLECWTYSMVQLVQRADFSQRFHPNDLSDTVGDLRNRLQLGTDKWNGSFWRIVMAKLIGRDDINEIGRRNLWNFFARIETDCAWRYRRPMQFSELLWFDSTITRPFASLVPAMLSHNHTISSIWYPRSLTHGVPDWEMSVYMAFAAFIQNLFDHAQFGDNPAWFFLVFQQAAIICGADFKSRLKTAYGRVTGKTFDWPVGGQSQPTIPGTEQWSCTHILIELDRILERIE